MQDDPVPYGYARGSTDGQIVPGKCARFAPLMPGKCPGLVLLVSPSLRVERHPSDNPHGYRERTGHTAQGSVEASLRHPGQKVEIYLLPNGRLEVRAAKSGGSIESFIGCGYRPRIKPLTIEEIAEIAAEGSAGRH